MQPSDCNKIERFIFDNHGVRGEIVKLTTPFEHLLHDYYPQCIKKIMMEMSVASVLMAATLKDGSEIMVQLRGGNSSPLKYALINIRQDLSFYGSAAIKEGCEVKDDTSLEELCSKDSVLVISVFPKNGQKWQGIVAINTKSISATLEDYFKESQQLPTNFFIRSNVKAGFAGGILLQIIPEIRDNTQSLEHLSILTDTITEQELYTLALDETLSRLFAHEDVKVFSQQEVLFRCLCSKARCENALSKISPQELKDLIEKDGRTSMTCQHCGTTYEFSKEELLTILHKNSQ
ncbi:MAG: Hsp33 family molecular chaperone HslO [Succinivibrio sp.]